MAALKTLFSHLFLIVIFLMPLGSRCSAQTVMKLTQANGTYVIPCTVNGVNMRFTFDTGAATVVLSMKEARHLFNRGLLTEDDFVGAARYQVANGEIVEGANIILKKIEIDDLALENVEATILPVEQADLLLGQTALSRFGKFQFDYSNNTLSIYNEHQPSNRANNSLATTVATGAVLDVEGNMYRTIRIGMQVWMAENLATSHYSNGEVIPLIENGQMWSNTSTGAACWYENTEVYKEPCGKLYNHYAVTDKRNICPAGWHPPSDKDWQELSRFLGGESVAGGKLKANDMGYWKGTNMGGGNESGFNGSPCGIRSQSGSSLLIGNAGWFWSSSTNDGYPSSYILGATTELLKGEPIPPVKNCGLSVRCLADSYSNKP